MAERAARTTASIAATATGRPLGVNHRHPCNFCSSLQLDKLDDILQDFYRSFSKSHIAGLTEHLAAGVAPLRTVRLPCVGGSCDALMWACFVAWCSCR